VSLPRIDHEENIKENVFFRNKLHISFSVSVTTSWKAHFASIIRDICCTGVHDIFENGDRTTKRSLNLG
jgi:hypothetical protein